MSLHQPDLLQGATHESRGGLTSTIDLLGGEATFGLISYYVFGNLRRIPVQFFTSGPSVYAWIDSGGCVDQRLIVQVTPEMNASTIGNFNALLKTYRVEATEILKNPNMWNECLNHEAGLLLLFQMMHEMRMRAIPVAEALGVTIRNVIDIRNSEQQAIDELTEMMATAEFAMPSPTQEDAGAMASLSTPSHAMHEAAPPLRRQQFSLA